MSEALLERVDSRLMYISDQLRKIGESLEKIANRPHSVTPEPATWGDYDGIYNPGRVWSVTTTGDTSEHIVRSVN